MLIHRLINRFHAPETGDEGADSSGGSSTVGTGNDARVKMLEDINDALDEGERGDELANVNNDDTTEPFRKPVVEAEPTEGEREEAAALAAEAAIAEQAEAAKVKIKVNGQEMEVTQDELIAMAQKVESADRYLAEAAAAKRDAVKEVVQPPEEIDYKALVHAIQVGTEEEAEAALRKLHTPQQRPSAMDDVSRVVDERLTFRDAMQAFTTEYSDIVSDPKLKAMAFQMDQEQRENGDLRPYAERYTEIGENLRGWVTKLGGGKKEEPTKVGVDREERKAAAPKTPPAASAKSAPPAAESEEDDSPHSVIAKMASARGGPQWMRS